MYNTFRLNVDFAVIAFITVWFACSPAVNGHYCVQKGPCNCVGSDGSVLDLSPLSNRSQPLLASSKSYLFMYHPCTDVALNSVGKNVCQKGYGLCLFTPTNVTNETVDFNKVLQNKSLGTFNKLAVNAEAVFQISALEALQIVYKNIVGDDVFTTVIKLECNKQIDNYKLTVEKSSKLEHVLVLRSKSCCPVSPSHISGASVFFLIIISAFSLYCIGGILVLKYLRGAKGIESIPNHEFWCKIAIHITDGFTYIKSCIRSQGPPVNSYETI
ncbi:hypothetical protein RUM43_014365 [Polyplax serrata]|uniref:MRH domain-containing protein n=1 Tax=Polyplax serrata TaxID=468196 RepID=A0AAN8RS21_POLSC